MRGLWPLLSPGGTRVALKGSSALTELAEDEAGLRRLGMESARVLSFGEGVVDPPTVVVEVRVGQSRPGRRTSGPKGSRRRRRPGRQR